MRLKRLSVDEAGASMASHLLKVAGAGPTLPVVLGTQGAAADQAEEAEAATTRVRALKAPCTIWRGMTVSRVDTPAPGQGRTGRLFQLICPTFWRLG